MWIEARRMPALLAGGVPASGRLTFGSWFAVAGAGQHARSAENCLRTGRYPPAVTSVRSRFSFSNTGASENVNRSSWLDARRENPGPGQDRDDVTAFQRALGVVEPDRAGAVEDLPHRGARGA